MGSFRPNAEDRARAAPEDVCEYCDDGWQWSDFGSWSTRKRCPECDGTGTVERMDDEQRVKREEFVA